MKNWSVAKSENLYNMPGWSSGYFKVNNKGNVCVTLPNKNGEVDLKEVLNELSSDDINPPILLRFPDIMEDRIRLLSESFKKAKSEFEFNSESFIVYPIKVNQMKPIVDEVVKSSKKYNLGLEAGSKPELHAVLSLVKNDDAPIICNGYKDDEYIEMALLAKKMGKDIYLVVEKLNELKKIIQISQELNVEPNIGIRIKLNSSGSGKWEDSGGDKSKFGLSSSELLEAVEIAKESNQLENIKMIHFHLGSQITKIRRIKTALRESAQYYYELRNLGCNIEIFDVGGGLGIDYDGTNSSNNSSINYTIQEYANDVIFSIVNISNKHCLPHPKVVIESGRAITAHHSILIFNVLETMSVPIIDEDFDLDSKSHENLKELYNIYLNINKKNMFEYWHDANQIREENNTLFSLSHLNLKTKALAERLYFSVANKFKDISVKEQIDSEELDYASRLLSDKYFCNFSLFQSLPDAWAIDQLFPVMPISGLELEPNSRATLQDVTCDSDGKMANFINETKLTSYLPIHKVKAEDNYMIGVFLVGAYQEILGDLHNLFGDTNAAHINFVESGYKISEIIDGETVDEVLGYVGYNAKKMMRQMEIWVTQSVKDGKISKDEGKQYMDNYRSGLYGYTYLEHKII